VHGNAEKKTTKDLSLVKAERTEFAWNLFFSLEAEVMAE
jgi:hypothetical protein